MMSAISRLRIGFADAKATAWRESMMRIYCRFMSVPAPDNWVLTLGVVGLVGYADRS